MLRISDAQRRARLAIRHALAPPHRTATIEDATRAVVALHATDPSTIALSAWARVDGLHSDDLHRALYDDRTLIKHMAMRRTLFVFPRAILPAAQAGAADRVATAERGRLIRAVEKDGIYPDGAAWLAQAEADVIAALAGGRLATASELRAELPSLAGTTVVSPGKPYGGDLPIGPRVITVLSAAGRIVRAANEGGWHISRPRWTAMDEWLGEPLSPPSADEGTAELVTAWLRAFGPGTTNDIKWWLGSTVAAVKRALADVEAVEVVLDHAETGWVLPDDTAEIDEPDSWVALLPALDPTIMGWQERAFYLGPHKEQLYDRNGNAGPSAWANGRVVGGWRQTPDGRVVLQLLDDPGAAARAKLEAEAERLTDWLSGAVVQARFPSPLSKQLVP